jgi:hypothetical protein
MRYQETNEDSLLFWRLNLSASFCSRLGFVLWYQNIRLDKELFMLAMKHLLLRAQLMRLEVSFFNMTAATQFRI